jgi:hypothetical protein
MDIWILAAREMSREQRKMVKNSTSVELFSAGAGIQSRIRFRVVG